MYSGDGHGPTSMSAGISNMSAHFVSNPLNPHLLISIKFFEFVLGPELRQFVLGRKYLLMVLAACGHVVKYPDALEQLQGVANL